MIRAHVSLKVLRQFDLQMKIIQIEVEEKIINLMNLNYLLEE